MSHGAPGSLGYRMPLERTEHQWGIRWNGTREQLIDAGIFAARAIDAWLALPRRRGREQPPLTLCSGREARVSRHGPYRLIVREWFGDQQRAAEGSSTPITKVERYLTEKDNSWLYDPTRADRWFPVRNNWTPEQHVAELCRKVRVKRSAGTLRRSDDKPMWQVWAQYCDEYLATLPAAERKRLAAAVDYGQDDPADDEEDDDD